jgi:hypothetical protein
VVYIWYRVDMRFNYSNGDSNEHKGVAKEGSFYRLCDFFDSSSLKNSGTSRIRACV